MIYLVRHGEAAASWGEHADPGLSDKGRAQAERVADRLLGLGATSLVSSPMQRCRETAMPFARKLEQATVIDPAISEIVTPEGVADRVAWLRELMAGEWPETMAAWRQGALEAVNGLPDGSVVFSHFVAINAVVGQLERTERVMVFRPNHCSITTLSRDTSGHLRVAERGEDATTRIL